MTLARPWREGGLVAWRNLAALVALNLVWLVLGWTIVLAGPVTLSVYEWIARAHRDLEPLKPRDFLGLLRRNLLPGLAWFVLTLLVVFLAYTNVSYWPRVLPDLPAAVVIVAWTYGLVLMLVMQPFVLEALTVERLPWRRVLPRALAGVARSPVAAHAWVLVPALAAYLAWRFRTPGALVLVSATLTFAALLVKPMVVPEMPPETPPDSPQEA